MSVVHRVLLRPEITLISIKPLMMFDRDWDCHVLLRKVDLIDAKHVTVIIANAASHSMHPLQRVNVVIVYVLRVPKIRRRLLIYHSMVLAFDHGEKIVAARR